MALTSLTSLNSLTSTFAKVEILIIKITFATLNVLLLIIICKGSAFSL